MTLGAMGLGGECQREAEVGEEKGEVYVNRWVRGLSMVGRGQAVSLGRKRCRVECKRGGLYNSWRLL